MKRFFAGLVCLPLLFASLLVASPRTDITHLLANYKTYQANFKQIITNQKGYQLQETLGKVMLQHPGRFRWETSKPNHQIIITNGQTLWVYDVDLMQATEQKLNKQGAVNPAALLTGDTSKLLQQFKVTVRTHPHLRIFNLIPTAAHGNFRRIQMQFSQGVLTHMSLLSNLNQLTIIKFTDIQVNHPLSPALFQFKAPKGVNVVKQ